MSKWVDVKDIKGVVTDFFNTVKLDDLPECVQERFTDCKTLYTVSDYDMAGLATTAERVGEGLIELYDSAGRSCEVIVEHFPGKPMVILGAKEATRLLKTRKVDDETIAKTTNS